MGMWLEVITVRFRHLSYMLSHYGHTRTFFFFIACSTMRALLHAYLVGLEPLGLFFCLSLRLHAPPFFMCAQSQQWIRCVCEQRMPWWDCAFAQARLSCRYSHNRLVCLISWHVLQKVFAISCQKHKRFRARRSRLLLKIKVYFALNKVKKKYWKLIECIWKH